MAAKVLWVTNIPTPYTLPCWRSLSAMVDLTVACLARTEPNRGWTVDTSDIDIRFLDAPVRRFGHERQLYLPNRALVGLINGRLDAVIVDGWESPAYLTAMAKAKARGIRTVLSYWSTASTHRFSQGPIAWSRRIVFSWADGVITPGPAATQAVLNIGVTPERIFEGFAAVDVIRFHTEASKLRRALREGKRGHHYLYIGQLIPRKNVHGLIQAFGNACRPGDRLMIGGEGPLQSALQDAAADLAIVPPHATVEFLGHLQGAELFKAYASAHTFVLPSSEEVWGLVVNEALASGLHSVVSRAAGVEPSVRGMQGVFSCTPDVEGLAEAMEHSRTSWRGYIDSPDILRHTPEAFASIMARAAGS